MKSLSRAADRCHRIGQNAVVRILYFVALGTLDVLLWNLLEKKFRDLGEFVEGQEKMKIVVHHTYDSVKDLQSMFTNPDDDDFDEDLKIDNNEENDSEGDDLIKLEDDLEQDIVQLAQEEMIMVTQGEEEDGADARMSTDAVQPKDIVEGNASLGQTEDEAICLSDDDDDDEEQDTKPSPKQESARPDASTSISSCDNERRAIYDKSKAFSHCRFYTQLFEGIGYGMNLLIYEGRLVVAKQLRQGNAKPAPGDVLIALNGSEFPLNFSMADAVRFMKQSILEAPVELTLIEDEEFSRYCKDFVIPAFERRNGESIDSSTKQTLSASGSSAQNGGGVIEILDDD
jgi:hypothetical protein